VHGLMTFRPYCPEGKTIFGGVQLIARYQRRFPGFDEGIVSMYARGMTVRELQGHLLELYGLPCDPIRRAGLPSTSPATWILVLKPPR
jgi:hypothetical protein